MSNFWTDLNRHLDEYERAEAEDEYMRQVYGEDWQEAATDPEDRQLISEFDVLDPPDNSLARTA